MRHLKCTVDRFPRSIASMMESVRKLKIMERGKAATVHSYFTIASMFGLLIQSCIFSAFFSRPGCKCHDGYTGAHCELLGFSIHKHDTSYGLHGVSLAATIFGIILLAIAIGMFVGARVVRRTRARKKPNVMIELSTMSSYRDEPLRAVNADDQSFDSMSLEDVELL
jgi:hypothetical protein